MTKPLCSEHGFCGQFTPFGDVLPVKTATLMHLHKLQNFGPQKASLVMVPL